MSMLVNEPTPVKGPTVKSCQIRKRRPPSDSRQTLGENVIAAMVARFKDSNNKPGDMAKAAGLSLSAVQRIIYQDVGATIDSINALARAAGLDVWQLLVPGMDPRNPPKLVRPQTEVLPKAMEDNVVRMFRQFLGANRKTVSEAYLWELQRPARDWRTRKPKRHQPSA